MLKYPAILAKDTNGTLLVTAAGKRLTIGIQDAA